MRNQIHKDIARHTLFGTDFFISLYYKLDNPMAKGCIIDIETTGLNQLSDKIITLGIVKKKLLLIYQLLQQDSYWRFSSLCNRLVKVQPIPRYGYACGFEADFLGIKDDNWHDLTEYFEVDYDDECPVRRYRLVDVTHHAFPNEPIDIDSSEVPQEWQQYLTTKNKIHLTNIIYHCICDLHRTKQLVDKKDIKLIT